ncbi:MAG: cupin domain-containing protein [Parabacteroides sp.]|nr:cupin domain-containing protein [Parabacteroides sp.]
MNLYIKWNFIIAVCFSSYVLTSCMEANKETTPQEVVSTELLRTSQSWDGAELPDYPQGRPEMVAVKYIIPAGQKLGWHHHVVMNHGVLVQGELTIIGRDGKTKVLREGEVVVEMVDAIHHGENRGTEPVILYMFYLSQKGMPLSVPNADIPLED